MKESVFRIINQHIKDAIWLYHLPYFKQMFTKISGHGYCTETVK